MASVKDNILDIPKGSSLIQVYNDQLKANQQKSKTKQNLNIQSSENFISSTAISISNSINKLEPGSRQYQSQAVLKRKQTVSEPNITKVQKSIGDMEEPPKLKLKHIKHNTARIDPKKISNIVKDKREGSTSAKRYIAQAKQLLKERGYQTAAIVEDQTKKRA